MAARVGSAPTTETSKDRRGGFLDFVLGQPVTGRLPARIGVRIREHQLQSELLIGWTQLILLSFFAVLYVLAPKTSEGTPFTPVPYVLGAFLVVTLVRLALAYRRWLPNWFLFLSLIVDIVLLFGLIWSFHLQYMQPAAFYLKAPTLLYAFIFIGLRALRFEPTFVIVAGLASAACWVALVVYATETAGTDTVITRDYTRYLTSNSVLIGAEVDKVIAILLVTAILAIALIRARRTLMRAVGDAIVARDLSRFVAPEVARQVAAADREILPGDAERIRASVLFCDIEGFSSIAERLSPDALMRTLNDYFAAVAAIVEREGGVIHQFMGDAILVTFNTARPHPDHAAAALRTALGIEALANGTRFGPGVLCRTRSGVNTGDVVAGAVGTRDRLLFTVYGDEVNIACRLEQLNKDHGTYILASEQTMAAAGQGFSGQPMGAIPVKGRSQPVQVFAVKPG